MSSISYSSPAVIPDLQTVTTAGNTTTNDINVTDGVTATVLINPIGIVQIDVNGLLKAVLDGFSFADGILQLFNSGGFNAILTPLAISANRTFEFPDNDGVLALQSDLTSIDLETVLTNGNIATTSMQIGLNSSIFTEVTNNGFYSYNQTSPRVVISNTGSGSTNYGYIQLWIGSRILTIRPVTMTTDRTVSFPNVTGTVIVGTNTTVTLVAGTVTIGNTAITASSTAGITVKVAGGTIGQAYRFTPNPGVGFTIDSLTAAGAVNNLDTSNLNVLLSY